MDLSINSSIGEGGNWEIHRIKEGNDSIIVRLPKMFLNERVNKYIKNYLVIKKLGLPTLNRVEKSVYEGKEIIITEDLNNGQEYIYVTANSVVSESQKLMHVLTQDILNEKMKERSNPEAEEYRYKNKLQEIINLHDFLKQIKNDIKYASEKGVLIEFDAYFFGTRKYLLQSELDYKVVDFDNIHECRNDSIKKLYRLNVAELRRALLGFAKHFIVKGLFQEKMIVAIEAL